MFYKYFSFPCKKREKIKRLNQLKRNKIWFSTRIGLNDPFDLQMLNTNALSEEVKKYYIEASNQKLCLCLTKSPKNTLMWAHYANSFTGYCLGFEYVGKDECQPRKIEYIKTLLECCNLYTEVFRFLKTGSGTLEEKTTKLHLENPDLFEKISKFLHIFNYQKTRVWEYEKEYRIITHYIGIGETKNKYGKLLPLKEIGLRLKEIIVGLNCSNENFHLLNELCGVLNLRRNKKDKIQIKVLDIQNGHLILRQIND